MSQTWTAEANVKNAMSNFARIQLSAGAITAVLTITAQFQVAMTHGRMGLKPELIAEETANPAKIRQAQTQVIPVMR